MLLSQLHGGKFENVNQLKELVYERVWVFLHSGGTVACRHLHLDEAKHAAEIEATRFQPSTSTETFEAVISGENSICCGVFVNDSLVGCASANITPASDGFASEAYIDNISVLAEYAGGGLGLLLTAYLLKTCNTSPFECMRATLEVRVGNMPAKRIYARFGFTCQGIRKRYYSHPIEDAEIHWLEAMNEPAFQGVLADAVSHALELFHVKQFERAEGLQ
jgi:ribosomal protein S18 acetylase RimI-like enzyme